MKITVEMSESEMRGLRMITGEKKKGPALRKVALDALNLHKRKQMAEKLIAGKIGVTLEGFEEAAKKDKAIDGELERRWRS